MSKREIALRDCMIAGYHTDKTAFTKIFIANRLNMQSAQEAYNQGVKAKENGTTCTCIKCRG